MYAPFFSTNFLLDVFASVKIESLRSDAYINVQYSFLLLNFYQNWTVSTNFSIKFHENPFSQWTYRNVELNFFSFMFSIYCRLVLRYTFILR